MDSHCENHEAHTILRTLCWIPDHGTLILFRAGPASGPHPVDGDQGGETRSINFEVQHRNKGGNAGWTDAPFLLKVFTSIEVGVTLTSSEDDRKLCPVAKSDTDRDAGDISR